MSLLFLVIIHLAFVVSFLVVVGGLFNSPILWPPNTEKLTLLKRPWCWERLKAGGEVDNRGWDGGMASSTQWTWIWVSSGRWWRTGKPGVLQSMGSQRLRHNWATEQQPAFIQAGLLVWDVMDTSYVTWLTSYALTGFPPALVTLYWLCLSITY